SNRRRMSLEQIQTMFVNVAEFWHHWAKSAGTHQLKFIWHGGEPFVQPIDFWNSVLALQRKIFGDTFLNQFVVNSVQSKRPILTEDPLPLLRNFDVGISYDVLNRHRVDTGQRSTEELVRRKIDWLCAKKMRVAGIAVISKSNIDHPQTVAEFFLS